VLRRSGHLALSAFKAVLDTNKVSSEGAGLVAEDRTGDVALSPLMC
jgi:hypothetical protein